MKAKTLFQEQSIANEKVAKGALTKVITDTISAHITTQELMTRLIVAGDSRCLECGINRLSSKAAKLTGKVSELVSAWRNLFGEDFDVEEITMSLAAKHFPVAVGEPSYNPYDESTWYLNPNDNTDRSKPASMEELIKETLKGKLPRGTEITVVNGNKAFSSSQKVFGLDPLDYESFQDFLHAVKEEIAIRNSDGRSEEIITEMEALVNNVTLGNSNTTPTGEFEDTSSVISLKKDSKKDTLNT